MSLPELLLHYITCYNYILLIVAWVTSTKKIIGRLDSLTANIIFNANKRSAIFRSTVELFPLTAEDRPLLVRLESVLFSKSSGFGANLSRLIARVHHLRVYLRHVFTIVPLFAIVFHVPNSVTYRKCMNTAKLTSAFLSKRSPCHQTTTYACQRVFPTMRQQRYTRKHLYARHGHCSYGL